MTHFLNTGNLFSKSQLINHYLQKEDNYLIITKKENITKYIKVIELFKKELFEINTFSDLVNCIYNKNASYIVDCNIFYSLFPSLLDFKNKYYIELKIGDRKGIDAIIKILNDFGYKYRDYLDGGDYKKNGDTLSIKMKNISKTYILSFFGDELEDIYFESGINSKKLEKIYFGSLEKINFIDLNEKLKKELIELFFDTNLIIDTLDISKGYKYFLNNKKTIFFDLLFNSNLKQTNLNINELYIENIEKFLHILNKNKNITIYTKNYKYIKNFLEYNNINHADLYETNLSFLKSYIDKNSICICDDNLSKIFVKKRIKKSVSENIDLLLQIKPLDYVVHIDHGIGIFNGIIHKQIGNLNKEYIEIEYKNNDKLFIPITEVRRISKYVGNENPTLTGLTTKEWSKKLEKAGKEVQKIAEELLLIYAERKVIQGFCYKYFEKETIIFQKSFEYNYTPDQISAIEDIFEDMSKNIPMDRIIVGDVGFGKTEVAFNAVYNAFLNKKQSIIVSPLVILAYEHYEKAIKRFKNFHLKIEVLTRFESEKKAKEIINKLKNGEIDLIIGTHRLFGEKIIYKDLGLLVIDEEHKFGVKEKEKIKEFKGNIDILSMSATPIPRSLNMALNGIRGISILSKPPEIRKGIETFISKFDESIIYEAGKKEFDRGGQIFFIHNRVESIEGMGELLQKIFKNKKIIITHGQLPGNELEERIIDFKNKKYDILLSSTVIENGIDFSNVNTIIINDANKFGISQIHQLRGRVGRLDKLGYCYLLFRKDKIKEDAAKRLTTIVEYSYLGAGFELAIRDLEIRGGGDILGIKQSGINTEIGINTYLKLLENKIEELKISKNLLSKKEIKIQTIIDLNISAFLSNDFFASELDKINFYRDIETIDNIEDLEILTIDFKKYVGEELNEESKNLFKLLKVKILAQNYKIISIKRVGVIYEINFSENIGIDDLKKFLLIDYKVYFIVSSLNKLKGNPKNFKNDLDFLNYLYDIMTKKSRVKIGKIKKI